MRRATLRNSLRYSRAAFDELEPDAFFSGFLAGAKDAVPDDAFLVRSNLPTHHLVAEGSDRAVILDRRWFEHIYAYWIILLSLQPNEVDELKPGHQLSQAYIGWLATIYAECAISLPDKSWVAGHWLDIAGDQIWLYADLRPAFEEAAELDSAFLARVLCSFAYEHEIGHQVAAAKIGSFQRLRVATREIFDEIRTLLAYKVHVAGGAFDGTPSSIVDFLVDASPQYDEPISVLMTALIGLADPHVSHELMADMYMFETLYEKFIPVVELSRPEFSQQGCDNYLVSLIIALCEMNNVISGSFVDQRAFGASHGDSVEAMMDHRHEATSRLTVLDAFAQKLVRRRRAPKFGGLILPHKPYDMQAFTDENFQNNMNRQARMKGLQRHFFDWSEQDGRGQYDEASLRRRAESSKAEVLRLWSSSPR